MVTMEFKLGEAWYPIEAYVDSGAAYTVLHAQVAEGVGFDFRQGVLQYLQVGDGSFIPVYLHDVEMQIGPERFKGRVGFSEQLGVTFNLSGRETVFEKFKICFQERQEILSFDS